MRIGLVTDSLADLPLGSDAGHRGGASASRRWSSAAATGPARRICRCRHAAGKRGGAACFRRCGARPRPRHQRAELLRQSAASGRTRRAASGGDLADHPPGGHARRVARGADVRLPRRPGRCECQLGHHRLAARGRARAAMAMGRDGDPVLARPRRRGAGGRRGATVHRAARPAERLQRRNAVRACAMPSAPTVGANFDPSHLFWMGADPLAATRALGDAIYHVHAKDTRIDP